MFTVYYDAFKTMSAPSLFQEFRPSSKLALTNLRCSFVMLNGSSLSNVRASIYALSDNDIGKLIQHSEIRQPAEFTDLRNGYYDIAFNFPGEVWLAKGQSYAAAIVADGYTFTEAEHVGWVRDWPEPTYDASLSELNPGQAPYRMHIAGKRYFGV